MGIHLYDVLSLGNAVNTHIQKTSYDNTKKKYDAFCEYQYRIHVLSFQMVMIKCLLCRDYCFHTLVSSAVVLTSGYNVYVLDPLVTETVTTPDADTSYANL